MTPKVTLMQKKDRNNEWKVFLIAILLSHQYLLLWEGVLAMGMIFGIFDAIDMCWMNTLLLCWAVSLHPFLLVAVNSLPMPLSICPSIAAVVSFNCIILARCLNLCLVICLLVFHRHSVTTWFCFSSPLKFHRITMYLVSVWSVSLCT